MPRSTPQRTYAVPRPTADDLLSTWSQANRAYIDFLRIDLDTSLTFSGLALESRGEKRHRNRRNARRGYDTIVRLLTKVKLSPVDTRVLARKLRRLKAELKELGEEF